MVMMLKDVYKYEYPKGSTFHSLVGEQLLKGARDKPMDSRRVGSCAVIRRTETGSVIRLFETDVFHLHGAGGMTIVSGGWRTRYTRGVINQLLPKDTHLLSDGGLWVVKGKRCTALFHDGMVVREDGTIQGAGMAVGEITQRKKQLAKAKRFCRRFVDRLLAGEVAAPGLGDCMYCQVEAGNQKTKIGVLMPDGSLRDHTFDEQGDHVRGHVDEGYFVPSMLWNAITEAGGPSKLRFAPRVTLQYLWHQGGKPMEGGVSTELFDREKTAASQQLRSVLSKYVKRRFGCEFSGGGWQSR